MAEQALAPAREVVPLGQSMHAVDPVVLAYVPAVQLVHDDDAPVLYMPNEQLVHELEPDVE